MKAAITPKRELCPDQEPFRFLANTYITTAINHRATWYCQIKQKTRNLL